MPRVCSCKSTLSSAIYLSVYGKTDLFIHLVDIDMHTCSWCSYLKDKMQVCIYTYIPTYLRTYIHRIHAVQYVCRTPSRNLSQARMPENVHAKFDIVNGAISVSLPKFQRLTDLAERHLHPSLSLSD